MPFICCPHLPNRPIRSALVSSALPVAMRQMLHQHNIILYDCPPHPALPDPVCTHPDLMTFYAGNGQIIIDRTFSMDLPPQIQIQKGTAILGSSYPQDIAYDACQIGSHLFCKPDATAEEILRLPLSVVPVRQGYAKCSIAVIGKKAAITEDIGLARAMCDVGIDVLLISPGGVSLPGYEYGFIGGACGKIAPDTLACFGDITKHPQYAEICAFCKKHGVKLLSLSDDNLTDYGSLIPLTE